MNSLRIKIYPKNKAHFVKLMSFTKKIARICIELRIYPIIYGSLAYLIYTVDNKVKINDIDFLISESSFPKLIKALKKKKIKHTYHEKWHTLIIKKGKLRIEFDSINFWQRSLPKSFNNLDFNGLKVRVVSLNTLKKIYRKASKISQDNPHRNLLKFNELKKLK